MYTLNYDIYTPVLHNESYPTMRTNSRLGDITYKFNTNALRVTGLNGLSFCFFVTWNNDFTNGAVDPHIWIKKGVVLRERGKIDLNDPLLIEKFLACEPLEAVNSKYAFFSNYDLELAYTLIWKTPAIKTIPDFFNVIIELKRVGPSFQTNVINYGQLKNLLVQYSGQAMTMGKPLRYYETELEKILSLDRSPVSAPFPGDCDLLLYDDNFKCKAIIEFKKRTSNGASIPIERQSISNYIAKDTLKYRRLNILREFFEGKDGSCIPLLNLFYSVAGDSEDSKIKIEAISHELQGEDTACFELPAFCDQRTSHSLILQHILSYIN